MHAMNWRGGIDASGAEPAPHPPAGRGLLADRPGAAARRPTDVPSPLGCRMAFLLPLHSARQGRWGRRTAELWAPRPHRDLTQFGLATRRLKARRVAEALQARKSLKLTVLHGPVTTLKGPTRDSE